MKTKRVFLAVSVAALILVITLVSVRAYYVAIALVAGTLIIGHRELWYFIRRKKLPPLDERVRENASKSVRNGLKMLKTFLLIAGISLGVFVISVFLHNAMSGLFGIEEPVFSPSLLL